MKIIGIGVDLLALDRIKGLVGRRGIEPFARRILSERERDLLTQTEDKLDFLQSRWAVKEALFKAASAERRLLWSEVSVVKRNDGRPVVLFEQDSMLSSHVTSYLSFMYLRIQIPGIIPGSPREYLVAVWWRARLSHPSWPDLSLAIYQMNMSCLSMTPLFLCNKLLRAYYTPFMRLNLRMMKEYLI